MTVAHGALANRPEQQRPTFGYPIAWSVAFTRMQKSRQEPPVSGRLLLEAGGGRQHTFVPRFCDDYVDRAARGDRGSSGLVASHAD